LSEGGLRLVILSDTHGRLPPEVVRACEGADHVIHAGDMGSDDILAELSASASAAPVVAVAGNVDPGDRAPLRARIDAGGWGILVQHIVWDRGGPSAEVRDRVLREGANLVVFGHTHEPLCRRLGRVVYLNPGSCGPKRFSKPRTYAEVLLEGERASFTIFDLEGGPPIFEGRFNISG
jgi:putative phosphoesterase